MSHSSFTKTHLNHISFKMSIIEIFYVNMRRRHSKDTNIDDDV